MNFSILKLVSTLFTVSAVESSAISPFTFKTPIPHKKVSNQANVSLFPKAGLQFYISFERAFSSDISFCLN